MFRKVLVANRGEIAVRIIRTCREMGIRTVAVFSEADRESLHVQLADEAYCIGPASPMGSYLNVINIVSIATLTGCDAVHPGYGFLAENADFAELCADCNVAFIGPDADAMNKMGAKDVARKTMADAGIPVVPGSDGLVRDWNEAAEVAENIGFPVLIKAAAGGGGKGIRLARNKAELENGFRITRQEAAASFGNPGVYLEKYVEDFRHVEVQIMADQYGNVVHLGERDCTIQRRLQKLIEEAPSSAVTEEKRREIGELAVRAAKAVRYVGAGTVEFIYDGAGRVYFMEMNTRIQVEHPVTECITGIDLVKEQISVASGKTLSFTQSDISMNGWAMECRINAEAVDRNFVPSPGKLNLYLPPGGPGIRVDSAAYPGCVISPHYDSLIAKLIAWGPTREEAISRMKRALSEFVVEGVETTLPFHEKVLRHEDFVSGNFNTKFLEKNGFL
ncbi:acetyl-CoA carboxylase biotin carboxylase subunit [Novibacillus thermophilus]|jgi:acetyl-CoA carboxylase biotin carboxylase subunit|uniref:Biotin carboxylase n=1 Tax=Novibacillus thermophilus TaxID=1471761 RepID=A0A1U9KB37_9BACL|nr:acetyl-CoA carboxylase biotin carboxylase subunit [Novibacillus thermophilus]AQS57258.1 acetyl-CoA carboxylase biotin carboxylase subunit [Novibacillus thermophilus]